MGFMKKWSFIILVTIFSSVVMGDSQPCLSNNETHQNVIPSGTSFYLVCNCEHLVLNRRPDIEWIGPDNLIIEPDGPAQAKVQTSWNLGEKSISLSIPSASRALNGKYKCVSHEQGGRQYTKTYEIDVYEPLYFLPTNISPQFLIEGQDSVIRCSARGHQTPDISWYKLKNFTDIENGTKYAISSEGLIIKNVSKSDEGSYQCTARVRVTGEDEETLINVEVLTPPDIVSLTAVKEVVTEGDPLLLNCTADGYPIPEYKWRKISNQNSSEETNASWVLDASKLVIKSVTMDDQGIYECIAQNDAGESRRNISIEVQGAPKITEFIDQVVEEGIVVSIICTAVGRPLPEVNITYYGIQSEYSPEFQNITSDTSLSLNLTFDKVHRSHAGLYNCDATNSVGSDSKNLTLIVCYKPFFDKLEEVVWTWDTNAVNLTCDFESWPEADVSWSFKGSNNADSKNDPQDILKSWVAYVSNTKENYLEVTPNKTNLYGTYECIAKNPLGEARKVFRLKEEFYPARLPLGQISIKDKAATSVTFHIYDVPTPDMPSLIGYKAEYDTLKNYNITNIHTNRSWALNVPFKIDKLEPMTVYKIRFAAINNRGDGPYSEYVTFDTPEKSVPESPLPEDDSEPIIIPANNKILKLKSPEHNGDPIDYYAIKYCQVNSAAECTQQVVVPTEELEIPNLDDDVSNYTLEIVAHNSMGNSTPKIFRIAFDSSFELLEQAWLSAEATVGIAIIVVIVCILILDVILFFSLKKGMIASCVVKKNKKKKVESKQPRDKKGLLKDNVEAVDSTKQLDNSHREFQYNKNTGVVTGKHSAV